MDALAARIDALLPQTQCRRCGFVACRPYAEALARGETELNRCPPGGAALIDQLAALLGRPPRTLDPACGAEGPPRVAIIEEPACIGCARCLEPCPTDAIIGARKHVHTVIAADCSGCELCIPTCPVDCIHMVTAPEVAGGNASHFRALFERRTARLARDDGH